MNDFLFDINEYKNVEKVYQIRLVRSETDQGEVIATFKYLEHCLMMPKVLPDDTDEQGLIITEFTKGKGITDFIAWEQVKR